MSLLSVTDLQTYYGESHVLQGLTMTAQRATVTAVLGRNGVGKTTLCRSLTGLTPARRGRVVFDGFDITSAPPHRIHELGISLVPQGRRIFASLTVRENLLIAARTRSAPEVGRVSRRGEDEPSRAPAGWDLEKVFSVFPRLAERGNNRGNELSGGEQQMLAIARALVARPKLLIMDEPTEGLAPLLVAEVGNVIRRLKQEGTSILLVEQNAAFAVRFADYTLVMSKGQIVHADTPSALWENEEVKTRLLGVPSSKRPG